MSATITPYLFFSGRCDEALEFYRKALGAETEMLMRYSESPEPVPAGMLQPGFESKVMHATVKVRGATLMASDGCDDRQKIEGFHLSIAFPKEAEAREVFEALSDGGSVLMPITKTFWSPCFGMVTDRFNVCWMVTVDPAAA